MRRLLLVLLMSSSPAFARSEKTLAYTRGDAWPAAVRFIRVDEHLKLTEKDADAGYVLFELREDKKTFRGSLELVEATVDGRHVVRFVMTIEDRPSWVEVEMLNRLEKKLRSELGSPAPAPTKPSEKPSDKPADDKRPDDKKPPKDDGGPPVSATP